MRRKQIFLPKIYNMTLIMKKHVANPQRDIVQKKASEISRSRNHCKGKNLFQTEGNKP